MNPVIPQFEIESTTIAPGGAPKQISAKADASGNQKMSLGTKVAGEKITDDVLSVEQRGNYTNITADTLIKTGAGRFFGFIVNSHISGTLKMWDSTSAATTVLMNTYTFPSGSSAVIFPVGVEFTTGLYADIVGTVDITIIWK